MTNKNPFDVIGKERSFILRANYHRNQRQVYYWKSLPSVHVSIVIAPPQLAHEMVPQTSVLGLLLGRLLCQVLQC